MSRYPSLTRAVLALLLAGVALMPAQAQSSGSTEPGSCTGGPVSLTASVMKFHVSLDDFVGAPATEVTLRLYNAEGTVVAGKKVTLAAGRTTTLVYNGSGLLRPQASFDSPLVISTRRRTVGSVEVFDPNGLRLVIPVQCIPNDGIGR